MVFFSQLKDALRCRIRFAVLLFCLLALASGSPALAQGATISGGMQAGADTGRGGALPGIGANPASNPRPIVATFPFTAAVGDTIGIGGAYFTGASSVKFSGVNARVFHVLSDNAITAVVPQGAITGPISVTTPAGMGTSAFNFYMGPIVESFSPNRGQWGTEVTLIGRNFNSTTGIKFNGVSASYVNIVSDRRIVTRVPGGATSGFINILSINDGSTFTGPFLIGPIPEDFTPKMGSPGTPVTITGSGFTGTTAVKFNGVRTTFSVASDSVIHTVAPGATTGLISVTTPSGTSYTAQSFYYGPYITSFSPKSGGPGTVVTLNGNNFNGASYVQFSGVPASFSVKTNNVIQTVVPAGAVTGQIGVTTPLGTGFSYTNFSIGPTITDFSPPAGSVGDTVTINGVGFASVSAVKFNGVRASITSVSDTMITATVPRGATTGRISVTAQSGTSYTATNFVVGPYITSFAPSKGYPGLSVTITGSGFTGATSVAFNSAPATDYTVVSDKKIIVTVPAYATTGPISIVTGVSYVITSTNFFVNPGVISFSPDSGPVGSTVTITGSGFIGAWAVKFHGVAATSFVVYSDSVIQAVVPRGATSGPISVLTLTGSGSSSPFFYVTSGG